MDFSEIIHLNNFPVYKIKREKYLNTTKLKEIYYKIGKKQKQNNNNKTKNITKRGMM